MSRARGFGWENLMFLCFIRAPNKLDEIDLGTRTKLRCLINSHLRLNWAAGGAAVHPIHLIWCIALLKWFQKVISPTKSSTYCIVNQQFTISWRFCGQVDILKPFDWYVVSDEIARSPALTAVVQILTTSRVLIKLRKGALLSVWGAYQIDRPPFSVDGGGDTPRALIEAQGRWYPPALW